MVNDIDYYYMVQAVGSDDACTGPIVELRGRDTDPVHDPGCAHRPGRGAVR